MPKDSSHIHDLIQKLSMLEREVNVDSLLEAAATDPLSAGEMLRQTERVLEAFKAFGMFGQDDAQDLHLMVSLGRTYARFSHLAKARETFESALEMADRVGNAPVHATLLLELGKIALRQRRWDDALDLLGQSGARFQEQDDAQGQAMVALCRGVILQEQGDLDGAENAYNEAIDLGQSGDEQKAVLDASSNLAVLATIRGDLEDAVARYQTCLARYQGANDTLGLAHTYHNLGMTHADREDWKLAMESFERAFELVEDLGRLDVMASIYLSRAELLLDLGDTSMAATCCSRALDIYLETKDHLGEADTYRLLGRVFTQRKQWITAGTLFLDCIRLSEEYGNALNVAEAYRDLGKMHGARGKTSDARTAFEQALSLFRNVGAAGDIAEVERLMAVEMRQ